MKPGIVFVQGTYDILNAGHVRSLALLAKQFEQVVVGLNTDELVSNHKPGQPILPYAQREEILEGLWPVTRVIPCNDKFALPYLQELDATGFATVEEWVPRQREAIEWINAKHGTVVILPYYPEFDDVLSSSMIRAKIRGR